MAPIYKHTQVVPSPLFWSCAALTAYFSMIRQGWWGLALVLALTALYWYSFSKLTITVGDGKVEFGFGGGLFKQSMDIANIISYEVVRSSPLHGWGLRFFDGGALYNVFGLSAIEFLLKNGSVIRLGTDEPERLSVALETQAIQRRR